MKENESPVSLIELHGCMCAHTHLCVCVVCVCVWSAEYLTKRMYCYNLLSELSICF